MREQFGDKPPSKEQQTVAALALGINSIGMVETLIADMLEMIKAGQRYSLDGYILCLSKIISHKVGWECILRAFKNAGETVPTKYHRLFNNPLEIKPQKTMQVE